MLAGGFDDVAFVSEDVGEGSALGAIAQLPRSVFF